MNAQVEDLRPELLVSMSQEGHAEFSFTPKTGGLFRLSDQIASTIILDAGARGLRLGLPTELAALATGAWNGWTVTDNALRLIGHYPGRPATYRVDVPITSEHRDRLASFAGELSIGVLDIDEAVGDYAITSAQTLPRVRA